MMITIPLKWRVVFAQLEIITNDHTAYLWDAETFIELLSTYM